MPISVRQLPGCQWTARLGVRRFIAPHGGKVIGQITLGRVDRRQAIEEGVEAAGFDIVNLNITSAHFPHQRVGIEEGVVLDLVQFGRVMATHELQRVLPTFGNLPDMDDMLACAFERRTDEQRQQPLVFFGASWVHPGIGLGVGCLRVTNGYWCCCLDLTYPKDLWHPHYVFPVRVRK